MVAAIGHCPTCNCDWERNLPPMKISGQNAYRCLHCKAVYSGEMLAATAMLAALKKVIEFQISEVLAKHDSRGADVCKEWVALKKRIRATLSQATGEACG